MLSTFPVFKPLEWAHYDAILGLTKEYAPYSDFNFVSMWSWNTRKKMMVSQLRGNLVVIFCDYITELPFVSFIGKSNLAETAEDLIAYSELKYGEGSLKLIPECVADKLPTDIFSIAEDEDAHDYIVSVDYLASLETMPGTSNQAAYLSKKFQRRYPECRMEQHVSTGIQKAPYLKLFTKWAKSKNLNHRELNEYGAFMRFIENQDCENHIVSLHDGDKMIAFATYELLSHGYAICHFSKADTDYAGVYDGLYFILGKTLKGLGVKYWNIEQDLGIPGLRRSKHKYKPTHFLRKYIVRKRD